MIAGKRMHGCARFPVLRPACVPPVLPPSMTFPPVIEFGQRRGVPAIYLLRYGLGGKEEFTQKQVAANLGISRSYVSRIEKNAIEKLRLRFADK